jgi:hypothetical protein
MGQLQIGEIMEGFQWNAFDRVRKANVLGATWRMNLVPFFEVEENSEICKKIVSMTPKALKGFLKEKNINKDGRISLLSVLIGHSSERYCMLLHLLDGVFVRSCFD